VNVGNSDAYDDMLLGIISKHVDVTVMVQFTMPKSVQKQIISVPLEIRSH